MLAATSSGIVHHHGWHHSHGPLSFLARRSPQIVTGCFQPSSSRTRRSVRQGVCRCRRFLRVLGLCDGFELRYARLFALLKLSDHVLAAC
jgi:hypothetical protein